MIPVLLAVPDHPDEPMLVRAAPGAGLRVLRRCMDAAELLAATAADPEVDVVLSPGLPRLSSGVLEQVGRGRVVVAVVTSAEDRSRLAALSVPAVLAADAEPERTMAAVARLLVDARPSEAGSRSESAGAAAAQPEPDPASPSSVGQVVAVWGPQGAPGRTTVAVGLADALSRRGYRTCLVDADTFAPSAAMALGVVEDAGGLAAACRLADVGALDARSLASVLAPVRDRLWLLGGLTGPDRWSDLRPAALDQVWHLLRAQLDAIVIDAGFCVDDVEDSSWARPRNLTERASLSAADHVVAVADASAAGAARLVRDWAAVTAVTAVRPHLVRNRSDGRRRAGQPSHRAWVHGVRALGVDAPVVELPTDHRSVTRAWSHGRTLGEMAPRSRLCHALERLALEVVSG